MAQVGYYKINKQYTEDDIMTFEDFNYIEDDIEEISNYLGGNLWDIQKQNVASKLIYNDKTKIYSSTDNDTRNYLQYKVQQYNMGTFLSGSQVNSSVISQTGRILFVSTRLVNSTRIRIANNGATSEFQLYLAFPDEIGVGDKYTIILDIIDTTIGASKFKNIQLLKGEYTLNNAPEYRPYISYTPKTWTKSDFLLYTYLNNIEEGLENIGKAYFRPYGWQDKKVWTGGMGFSYRDVNRWINNINLIVDRLDNESSTLFPSDTLYPSEDLLPH